MTKAPNLWRLQALVDDVNRGEVQTEIWGQWVPARPMGLDSLRERLRLAWGVFVGRYDAVQWPNGQ